MKNIVLTTLFFAISFMIFSQTKVERKNIRGETERGVEIKAERKHRTFNKKVKIGKWTYHKGGVLRRVENYNSDARRDGQWKEYFKSGKISHEYQYKNGTRVGIWKEYFPSGGVAKKETYTNGKLTGKFFDHYIQGGAFFEEGEYVDGKLTGNYKRYYKNGKLMLKLKFKEGEILGSGKFYRENGEEFNGKYEVNSLEIKSGNFTVNQINKGAKIKVIPMIYRKNGMLKSKYELKDKYATFYKYFSNGKLEQSSNYSYARSKKDNTLYIGNLKTGITKKYILTGQLVEKVDEDFENAEKIYGEKIKHMFYLKSANINKNSEAMLKLGNLYLKKHGDIKYDYNTALSWFEKAIKNGAKKSSVAYILERGTQEKEKELKLLVAHKQNSTLQNKLKTEIKKEKEKQLQLLVEYFNENKKKIVGYLNNGKYGGDIVYDIIKYYDDLKIEKNNRNKEVLKVIEDYKKAKERKKKEAEFRKYKKQFDWMQEQVRAGQDNGKIQYNLGIFYGQGLGVAKDLNKAVYWSNKSAENGGGIEGLINAAVFTLEPEGKLVEQMNSLGKTESDNKKWNELSKKKNDLYRKAIVYLEKVYSIKGSNTSKSVLTTLNNIYKTLKTDTEISKKVKKIVEGN